LKREGDGSTFSLEEHCKIIPEGVTISKDRYNEALFHL
jgi:hypothetical protein